MVKEIAQVQASRPFLVIIDKLRAKIAALKEVKEAIKSELNEPNKIINALKARI